MVPKGVPNVLLKRNGGLRLEGRSEQRELQKRKGRPGHYPAV